MCTNVCMCGLGDSLFMRVLRCFVQLFVIYVDATYGGGVGY